MLATSWLISHFPSQYGRREKSTFASTTDRSVLRQRASRCIGTRRTLLIVAPWKGSEYQRPEGRGRLSCLGFHLVHGGALGAFGQSIAHILIFQLPVKSNVPREKHDNALSTERLVVIRRVGSVSNKRAYNVVLDQEVFTARSAKS